MPLGSLIPGSEILDSGLEVYRAITQASVQNLANKDTVKTSSGKPYEEQMVVVGSNLCASGTLRKPSFTVAQNTQPGPKVYDPHHPEADGQGMVHMTNVQRGKNIAQFTHSVHMTKLMLSCYRTVSGMARDAFEIFS